MLQSIEVRCGIIGRNWISEDEWKIQRYLIDIKDKKLEIDGVPIEMANYSVSYIYNLLKKKVQ